MARLRDLLFFARNRSPRSQAVAVLHRLRRWAWSRQVLTVYRAEREASAERAPPFRVIRTGSRWDALDDFARYTGSDWRLSRAGIVAEARRRLAQGEHRDNPLPFDARVHDGCVQQQFDSFFAPDQVIQAEVEQVR